MTAVGQSRVSRVLAMLMICALAGQSLWAERPPQGYARPPIHVKGNATTSPTGLSPAQVQTAYGFSQVYSAYPTAGKGAGQIIAIVDAYDHPNIASDLATFSTRFGLPQLAKCSFSGTTVTNAPCFGQLYASGSKPRTNSGWALEISLDVEWAHAIAPQATILLVEASTNSFTNLMSAVDVAVRYGASVVSQSFGGSEFSSETNYDSHYSVGGVTFTASSGDNGTGVEYPAASPNVVSVGGTTLALNNQNQRSSETAWGGSGGGISAYESASAVQNGYGLPNNSKLMRGVPDVAYDGDPNSGFPVYDSVKYNGQSGWFQVGGTSAGAPQWAALFAIANAVRNSGGKSPLTSALNASGVYGVITSKPDTTHYYDVTSGTNGSCGAICSASADYDYVTGLGSPRADALVPALASLP